VSTPALIVVLLASALVTAAAVVAAVRARRRVDAAEAALVALARTLSEDGGSRERLCTAARMIAHAEVALLTEPHPREEALVVTYASGAEVAGLRIPLEPGVSRIARAYLTGETEHVADTSELSGPAAERLRRHSPVRSGLLAPVRRGDSVVGVLVIGWLEPTRALPPGRAQLVELLACEAARAIERDARVKLLARQARTDELTALPNRRAWDEAVARELARAERTGDPLCLALLDLDHFKAYNDRLGHQAGDRHLRRTAAAWRRELRTVDVLARYGGEEFGVLMPSTTLEEAHDAIERVRLATPDGETASAGVVQWDGSEPDSSLLARADAALYRAKDAGRAVTVDA
jgi:diguanylate cyclase (GGDEF)-like protein